MTVLRVVDIETTGVAPPAEIIEFGHIDLVSVDNGWDLKVPATSTLYRPTQGIPPETMAVHHITQTDVAGAPVCTLARLREDIMGGIRPDVLVAHNCSFEQSFISGDATDGLPWICTYKCALRLWPEAPGHSNQILRYWRKHNLDPQLAMPPHRAAPDAFVTAHLLCDMLGQASLEQMMAWTAEPKLLTRLPFGKYKGAMWTDVPDDYLAWIIRQSDIDTDVLWNANRELNSRLKR